VVSSFEAAHEGLAEALTVAAGEMVGVVRRVGARDLLRGELAWLRKR